MLRAFGAYLWEGVCLAWRGSINSALNWAGIIGVGIVGAYLERRGSQMSDPHTWEGLVGWTLVYTAVAWCIIFTIRLIFLAPFQLYYKQKTRADGLEGLRQIANDASRPPSFDIGFEYSPFDHERSSYRTLVHHSILRIWVENSDNRPIEDCRVVIEAFGPTSPVRMGAMLFPDNRGDDKKSTRFFLAPTERQHFTFLEVESIHLGLAEGYELKVLCDQEGTGTFSFIDRPVLEAGKHYYVTLVVHGRNANSRRLDLLIDAISGTELHVVERETTASYRKELAHEQQGSQQKI